MPFCPKCRGEFQDWVDVCPDCGVELVEKLPTLPKTINNKLRNDKLVTIARFSHPEEAYIIAARLESEGIHSSVTDEFAVTFNWAFSNGVKVQVIESDAEEALRILSSTRSDIQEVASTGEKCPQCNSSNIQYKNKTFFNSLTYFMFLLTLFISWFFPSNLIPGRLIKPTHKRNWMCQTCGYQWKNQ